MQHCFEAKCLLRCESDCSFPTSGPNWTNLPLKRSAKRAESVGARMKTGAALGEIKDFNLPHLKYGYESFVGL